MQRRGYTLIELMAVLAILSVLALGVMPLAERVQQREREQDLRRALWTLRDALDAYKKAVDHGHIARTPGGSGYPPNLNVLVEGVADAQGQTRYFLRRMPRDPFAPQDHAPEATWALRSYASSPDAPQEGSDVFDVYSRSPLTGSNGVPLRAW